MCKRICAIGAIVALGLPGAASATVTGQTVSVTASPPAQPKKQFGPLNSLMTVVDTAYTPPFTPTATQTVINFSKDLMFNSGGLPQCDLSAVNTLPQAQSDAICGASKVGTGAATINNGLLTGVVSAYNGTPISGSPTIGLHTDIFTSTGSYAFSTTLTGVLNTSANSLTVAIPPTGTAITHFATTINKVRTGKQNGQPIYFVMARCSKKKWVSGATSTFDNGQQISSNTMQNCKQTAPKKQGKQPKNQGKQGKGKQKKGGAAGPPKSGPYNGKTDQEAISTPFRKVQFTLNKRTVTLTTEPTVARGACVSSPVFTLGGTTATKKLSRNRSFSLTRTFLGNKIDKIHGRFVSSTEVEGYAIYHFFAQDLCSEGKTKVNFKAKHQ